MDTLKNEGKRINKIMDNLREEKEMNWWSGWMEENGVHVEKKNFIVRYMVKFLQWLIYDSFGRKAKREYARMNYILDATEPVKEDIERMVTPDLEAFRKGDFDPKTYNPPKTKCPECGREIE
jgi:hypothetical protein